MDVQKRAQKAAEILFCASFEKTPVFGFFIFFVSVSVARSSPRPMV
jgi:hypothetical protein